MELDSIEVAPQTRLRFPYYRTTVLLDADVRNKAGKAVAPEFVEMANGVMAIMALNSTTDAAGITPYLALLLPPPPDEARRLTLKERANRADALGRLLPLPALKVMRG
eukprot:RCo043966